jgi:hypothetical protein
VSDRPVSTLVEIGWALGLLFGSGLVALLVMFLAR